MGKHFVKIEERWVDAHAVVAVAPYAGSNGSAVLLQGRDDPWYFDGITPDEFVERLVETLLLAQGEAP